MSKAFRLGVVINPFAGIGGAMALKGSDGEAIRQQALAAGATKLANDKMARALTKLTAFNNLSVLTASGEMGEHCCAALGLEHQVIYTSQSAETTPEDTENAVRELVNQGVDLILFAGGDGTARNVCSIVADRMLSEV